jgi:hypothetical protein
VSGPPGEIERRLCRNHNTGKKLLEGSDGKRTYSEHDTENRKIHLRQCRRFAKAYSSEELESLLKLQTKHNTPLPWSVVRLLMAVKPNSKPRRLEMRAAKEGWSAIRTATIIQAKVFRKKYSEGGRPCSPPPDDLEELIQQVERFLAESMRRYTLWVEILPQMKDNPPVEEDRQRLKSRILVAVDSLNSVVVSYRKLRKILNSLAQDYSRADERPSVPTAESGSRKK